MKIICGVLGLVVLFFGVLCSSCYTNDFNYEEAIKIVELSNDDLILFTELNDLYLSNLVNIRKSQKPSSVEGIDTTFLSLNAYSVLGLDSSLYADFIQELQSKHVFTGNVKFSSYGTVKFELKEMTEIKWNDFNETYIHELIFDNSGTEGLRKRKGMMLDSLLRKDLSYVLYNVQTGW